MRALVQKIAVKVIKRCYIAFAVAVGGAFGNVPAHRKLPYLVVPPLDVNRPDQERMGKFRVGITHRQKSERFRGGGVCIGKPADRFFTFL